MMRLGTQTGSLVNHIYSRAELAPVPVVGMGATVLAWTDRYAGTIIDVGLDGSVTVREDAKTRTDKNGMSDAQEYAYEANPHGRTWVFLVVLRGRLKGQLREGGHKDGYGVMIGYRQAYYDFSF